MDADASADVTGVCQCVRKARSESFELQPNTGHRSNWELRSVSPSERVAVFVWAASPVFDTPWLVKLRLEKVTSTTTDIRTVARM